VALGGAPAPLGPEALGGAPARLGPETLGGAPALLGAEEAAEECAAVADEPSPFSLFSCHTNWEKQKLYKENLKQMQ
jgi:hypothetical protein